MRLSDAQVWGAIAGLVLMVFLTRNAFLVVPMRWQPRGAVERALRHAPLAALVALVTPSMAEALIAPGASLASVWVDARLPAALAALGVSRLTRSAFPGMAAGVAVLWLIDAMS